MLQVSVEDFWVLVGQLDGVCWIDGLALGARGIEESGCAADCGSVDVEAMLIGPGTDYDFVGRIMFGPATFSIC